MRKVTLTITINEKGICEVSGPIEQKVMCYGMLEEAKNVIREFKSSLVKIPETGA